MMDALDADARAAIRQAGHEVHRRRSVAMCPRTAVPRLGRSLTGLESQSPSGFLTRKPMGLISRIQVDSHRRR